MEKVRQIKIPTHRDPRGDLSVVEFKDYIDWIPKRVYYVTNTKEQRGGHAVIGERKIYICMQGDVKAKFHDGQGWKEFNLHGPDDAIIMDGLCWRDFEISNDGVLCAISNMNYEKDKYIYNYDDFLVKVRELG